MRCILLLLILSLASCDRAPPKVQRPEAVRPASPPQDLPHTDPTEEVESEDLPAPTGDTTVESRQTPVAKLKAMGERHKAWAAALYEAADHVDDAYHIGSALNEIGVPEASCYAKGVMLGLDSAVAHLTPEGDSNPNVSTEDEAFEARTQALFHSNFAHNIAVTVERDPAELTVEWNLDCPGKHDIPVDAHLAQPNGSSFYRIENDGAVLKVLGDIEPGFADRIIEALQANPSVKTVSLGSGGGLVLEAMRAGAYIRQGGYDTVLWNGCYSACPLVFMGGVNRTIWSPYPELGFHQMYLADGTALPMDRENYGPLAAYVSAMGVDAHFVLAQMWSAAPQSMTNVAGHELDLCKSNVATWIQRRCGSDQFGY
jgi:hypothetical protein